MDILSPLTLYSPVTKDFCWGKGKRGKESKSQFISPFVACASFDHNDVGIWNRRIILGVSEKWKSESDLARKAKDCGLLL
jgi:hypothetical protein